MLRKYHNRKLRINPWHREEELHNNHKTLGRQTSAKQQALSLFPIKMIAKLEWTRSNAQQNIEQLQTTTMGATITIQQQQNHRLRTDSSLSHWVGVEGGLNAFYWLQIFALDSAVVEVQEMFSSHGGLLNIAMYHHGEHSNQINTL